MGKILDDPEHPVTANQIGEDPWCSNTSVVGPSRAGTHEIKFMFRKINISKKKQFYQEIPIENMRYLKQKENISFHQNCFKSSSLYPHKSCLIPSIDTHKRKNQIQCCVKMKTNLKIDYFRIENVTVYNCMWCYSDLSISEHITRHNQYKIIFHSVLLLLALSVLQ